MTEDRRTKAQLIVELANAEDAVRLQRAQIEELRETRPARVPLADALAGCVRALDTLTRKSSNYGSDTVPDIKGIESVLRLLATRYGVQLAETVTQPCDRLHSDDMTIAQHVEAIRFGEGF